MRLRPIFMAGLLGCTTMLAGCDGDDKSPLADTTSQGTFGLKERIDALETGRKSDGAMIAELRDSLTKFKAELEARLDGQGARLDGVEIRVAGLETAQKALQALLPQVEKLQDQVAELVKAPRISADDADRLAGLGNLSTEVGKLRTDLDAAIALSVTDIAAIRKDIETNRLVLGKTTDAATAETLTIRIAELEKKLDATNRASTTSVEAFKKRIADLELSIRELMGLRNDIPALTKFVDPFIGTGPGQKYDGPGGGTSMGAFDFPAAGRPFGMVNWGPDTTTPSVGYNIEGYHYDQNEITGFTLTHLSGVGCTVASAIPFLPMADDAQTSPEFDHKNEAAGPGYYHVKFSGSNIETDLTATTRTGVGKFTYPSGSKALLKITAKTSSGSSSSIDVDTGAQTVSGSATDANFCGSASRSPVVYFYARIDQPFANSQSGAEAVLTFTTAAGAPTVVGVSVGVSFVSVENAKDNLEKESGSLGFDEIKKQADEDWNKRLNAIQATGGNADDTKKFYTALYHALQTPSTYSDFNGEYLSFDNASKIEKVEKGRVHYSSFSSWDTYRSLIPLQALLYPQEVSDMMQSLINDANQCGGVFPMWVNGNSTSSIMPGDGVSIMVAQAHAFGAIGFDTAAASTIMRDTAFGRKTDCAGKTTLRGLKDYMSKGYIPYDSGEDGHTSSNMEYTSTDFAISRFVAALGTAGSQLIAGGATDEGVKLRTRSGNWKNLFNPDWKNVTGQKYPQIQPRKSDGTWPEGYVGNNRGYNGRYTEQYREGNAEQYTWMAPHDIRGLINAVGGEKAALARLDTFTTHVNAYEALPGYLWIGNEPNLASPFLYNWTSQPYKTQAVVRRITSKTFHTAPDGIPGNDDLGAISGWLAWASMGLYPEILADPGLTLTTPVFPKIIVWQSDKKLITITADKPASTYIQSVQFNGKAYDSTWLPIDLSKANARLDFSLGDKPSCWGSAPAANIPPSFGPDGKDTLLSEAAEACALP
jgi:predicted alpha-1,2-mannosidase